MPATPPYRPTDMNPDAAEAGHTHQHSHSVRFQVPVGMLLGAVVANPANVARVRNHLGMDLTIVEVHVEARSAPTGRALLVELRRNGTNVQTVTLPAGQTLVSVTGLTIAWAAGQHLEAIPTQVGSTAAGSDLIATVVATAPSGVGGWPA